MSDFTERLRRKPWYSVDDAYTGREAADRIDELETQLAAIDTLHISSGEYAGEECIYDGHVWPCREHRLLHPEEKS